MVGDPLCVHFHSHLFLLPVLMAMVLMVMPGLWSMKTILSPIPLDLVFVLVDNLPNLKMFKFLTTTCSRPQSARQQQMQAVRLQLQLQQVVTVTTRRSGEAVLQHPRRRYTRVA